LFCYNKHTPRQTGQSPKDNKMINLTSKAKNIIKDTLYIENNTSTKELKSGKVITQNTLVIACEEGSCFYVEYIKEDNGNLTLLSKSSYIEDIPAHISTTKQLTGTLERLVKMIAN